MYARMRGLALPSFRLSVSLPDWPPVISASPRQDPASIKFQLERFEGSPRGQQLVQQQASVTDVESMKVSEEAKSGSALLLLTELTLPSVHPPIQP